MKKMVPSFLRKLIKYIAVFMVLCIVLGLFRLSAITTYIPFTGKYFDIDAKQVESIYIQRCGDRIIFDSEEDITTMVDKLNAMRYWFCYHYIEAFGRGGQPDYRLYVNLKDGTTYMHYLTMAGIRSSISIEWGYNGWVLLFSEDDVSFFINLWNERAPEMNFN